MAPSPSMHVCSRAARRHEARRLGRPLPFDSGASVAVRACKKGVLRERAVGPGRSGQSVFCLIVFAPPCNFRYFVVCSFRRRILF